LPAPSTLIFTAESLFSSSSGIRSSAEVLIGLWYKSTGSSFWSIARSHTFFFPPSSLAFMLFNLSTHRGLLELPKLRGPFKASEHNRSLVLRAFQVTFLLKPPFLWTLMLKLYPLHQASADLSLISAPISFCLLFVLIA